MVSLKIPFLRVVAVSRVLASYNRSLPAPATNSSLQHINRFRFLSSDQSKCSKTALKKEKEKLRTYVTEHYMEYLKNYAKVFESKFPSAMKMYRVFSVGIKDFYKDFKIYISVRMKVNREHGFYNVSRQDIELYQKMASDMWRIVPVLVLSAIPFGNYIIFLLALWKPRKLLCSHFWSIQQRAEFSVLDLKERLKFNKPVFRSLQAQLDVIDNDDECKQTWMKIIGLLGSGVHPNPEDIIDCCKLFAKGPYHLDSISYGHAGYLMKMHGLRKGLFRRKKLQYRAYLLREMDKAIIREGGVESLNTESLRNACQIRGLNSSHLSNQDMATWLQQWLSVSELVDKNSYSLILHCPIFFGYNHPQNWVLIY